MRGETENLVPAEQKKYIVLESDFPNYPVKYFGETKCSLNLWSSKHWSSVENFDIEKNEIVKHWAKDHIFQ